MQREPKRLNHPLSAYLIGLFFIGLMLMVLAGVIHHLTISHHGPGLLLPLFEKYKEHRKSEILTEVQRIEDFEKHRHFHLIDDKEYPELPENMRPVCFICHSEYPHSKNKRIRALMNIHTQFFACETCHIKEVPGTEIIYKWDNPMNKNSKGPFYGTSYDSETRYLSQGNDQIAKITPFIKSGNADKFVSAIQMQDAPMAKDYMKVRDKLSPEQREGIKNKFHKSIKPIGHDCKICHIQESILDFKKLGFDDGRISNLKMLDIIGMLSRYDEFYLPELFTVPEAQRDKQ